MSTPTLHRTLTGDMPRVNLLPPEIAEARRLRRIKAGLAGAVVAAVAVVGVGGLMAHEGVTAAQHRLDAAEAQHTALARQLARYGQVKAIDAQLHAYQSTLSTAMSGEVLWSQFLNDLTLKIPDHVWLTSLQATENRPGQVPAQSPQPGQAVTAGGIGTMTFGGVAYTHDDVASWLDAMSGVRGFADPYFSSSTESAIGTKKVVDFQSTTTLTPAALSGRYAKAGG